MNLLLNPQAFTIMFPLKMAWSQNHDAIRIHHGSVIRSVWATLADLLFQQLIPAMVKLYPRFPIRFPNNKGVIAMDKTGLSWTSTSKQWTLKRRFQPSNKLDFFTIKPWDISEFCDLKKQRMGRNLKQMDLTIDLILISIDFIINRGRHEASKLHQFKCFAEPRKRMKQPREV